jgi:hypothetical protein
VEIDKVEQEGAVLFQEVMRVEKVVMEEKEVHMNGLLAVKLLTVTQLSLD